MRYPTGLQGSSMRKYEILTRCYRGRNDEESLDRLISGKRHRMNRERREKMAREYYNK